MCSLKAGVEGLSENIYATSILDRFLEHPRVMIFCNNHNEDVYISSADLMTRNLDYRIEVGTRILDPVLKERIIKIFDIQSNDNQKSRILNDSQSNHYVPYDKNTKATRAQIEIFNYLNEIENNKAK